MAEPLHGIKGSKSAVLNAFFCPRHSSKEGLEIIHVYSKGKNISVILQDVVFMVIAPQ